MDKELPSKPFTIFPAKTARDSSPGIFVVDHCRIVGYVAQALLKLLPDSIRDRLGNPKVVAALHDVGKISPGFQLKYFAELIARELPELSSIPISRFITDHAIIGMAAVTDYLKNNTIAEIVGAHHGGIKSRIRKDDFEGYGGISWSKERKKLISFLIDEFGPVSELQYPPIIRNVIAGLVSVADWIGSDETYFPNEGVPKGFDYALGAQKAVAACGWATLHIKKALSFEAVFDNQPYKIQKEFIDAISIPGLYILESPMGTGKTEAALYAAYRLMATDQNRGLFFGLPTRLTSEKIYERVEIFLSRICEEEMQPKLAHGRAWLTEFAIGGENLKSGGSWFNSKKRRLLHPFAVGTIDQALLSVLNVKHFFVRTFALAGKVVILDEVHSYDLYTGTLMEELISQLLEIGCTVIVLSATLTKARRMPLTRQGTLLLTDKKREPYPLITCQIGDMFREIPGTWNACQNYQVTIRDLDDNLVAKEAIYHAEGCECVLLIANTVAKAQKWYAAIKGEMRENAFPLGMIHSKFPGFRRTELEKEWISKLGKSGNRPNGCVLIGTQVLEQSLDIDCDYLISEIAPTDMLLQRMGRQWRHTRNNRPISQPKTLIISPSPDDSQTLDEIVERFGKGNCYVYQPYLLFKTWLVWSQHYNINLPKDIRPLLEETYQPLQESDPPVLKELYEIMVKTREDLKRRAMASKSTVAGLVMQDDREEVLTRYSDYKTQDVLLVRYLEKNNAEASVRLLDNDDFIHLSKYKTNLIHSLRLQQNVIALPAWLLQKMSAKKPEWLEKHFFEPVVAWEWDEITGKLSMDGVFTGHTYDPHRGLRRIISLEGNQSIAVLDDTDVFDPFDKNRIDW